MSNKKYPENRKWGKFVCLLVGVVVIALVIQSSILNNANRKNGMKTSQVLLDQAISVIEKNQQSEEEMIQSLKEDYMVRAKAVSYIIDASPEAEYDIEELQKIADLMLIDEIHLFDESGTIYSGSVPQYYGYNFDSGEQMAYFKPMLEDKNLTMCQDVTPNTSEGKSMMYAITWNEAGTRMVQVGIEPVRLLEEVSQNEVSTVVSNMPMYEGINIYVADVDTGEIYGATDETKIGKRLDDIGIVKKELVDGMVRNSVLYVDGEKCSCIFKQSGDYVVGVTFATATNNASNFTAMLILAIYLGIASAFIMFMVFRVLKANREKQEQFAILASMSEIYYSMHLINLEDNSVLRYSGQEEKSSQIYYKNAQELMAKVVSNTATEAYQKKAELFTDLSTIAQRMEEKKIISEEFVGQGLGWFRASFITILADKNKKPVKMIFTVQSIDDEKRKEEKLIYTSNTDELTGCFNRRAYEKDISSLPLDKAFIYISMDVNGLKIINDSLGHEAGDELLEGASFCMKQCFNEYGKVYRTGGDEFIAIIFADSQRFAQIKEKFDKTVADWSGKYIESMTISCGFVSSMEQKWASVNEIEKAADIRMYEKKAMYYRKNGIDRRGQSAAYVALGKLYSQIVKLNFNQDSYRILNWEESKKNSSSNFVSAVSDADRQNGEKKNLYRLSVFFDNFENESLIHPKDLEKYRKIMNIDYLKTYFDSSRSSLTVSYRRKEGVGYRRTTVEIIPVDGYSIENREAYLYAKK